MRAARAFLCAPPPTDRPRVAPVCRLRPAALLLFLCLALVACTVTAPAHASLVASQSSIVPGSTPDASADAPAGTPAGTSADGAAGAGGLRSSPSVDLGVARVRARISGMSGLPSLPGAGARIPGSARRAPVLPTTTPGLPDQAVVDIIPSDTSLTLSVGRQSMDLGLGPDLLAGILPDTASLDGLRLRSRAFGPLTISGLAARMDDVTNSGLHPETEALLYGGEARLAPPDVPATLSFLWYRQRLGADAAGKLQAPGGSASSGIAANTYGLSTRLALDRDVTLASSALLQRGRADDEALSAYAFAAGVAVTPPLPLVDSMELGFATFSGGDDDGGEITAFQPLLAGDSAVGAMDGFLAASNLSVLRSAVTFQGPGNLTLTTEFMQYLAAGQGDVYAADGAALASPDDGLLGRELRLSLALPLEQDLTLDGSARVFAPAPDLADEVDMGDAPGVSLMFGLHMNM